MTAHQTQEAGVRTKSWTQKGNESMYTKKEIEKALSTYDKLKSQRKTVKKLGYPSRYQLQLWSNKRAKGETIAYKKNRNNSPPRTHSSFPIERKIDAVTRVVIYGESQRKVAYEIGICEGTLYNWKIKYLREGTLGLVSKYPKQKHSDSDPSYDDLRREIDDLRFELDVMKEMLNIIKKDPRVDLCKMKNTEKVVLVDALKGRYALPKILKLLQLPKSSYYYHLSKRTWKDKYEEVRSLLRDLFCENNACYGYRRLKALLAREGINLSEKVVIRLMKEEDLVVKLKRRAKYSSFKGDLDPLVPNLIARDFHADEPNNKWLTDITEFSIPAGKVYLSPILDCFDGMVPAWSIGTSPNAELVNSSLEKAIETLTEGESPFIHSDRGVHYFWKGWLELIEDNNLTRSMSKKGCSPDNSACEGFFGHLKSECFYGKEFKDYSIKQFIEYLNNCINWHNTKRIKKTLGYQSPVEYRLALGYAA